MSAADQVASLRPDTDTTQISLDALDEAMLRLNGVAATLSFLSIQQEHHTGPTAPTPKLLAEVLNGIALTVGDVRERLDKATQ